MDHHLVIVKLLVKAHVEYYIIVTLVKTLNANFQTSALYGVEDNQRHPFHYRAYTEKNKIKKEQAGNRMR